MLDRGRASRPLRRLVAAQGQARSRASPRCRRRSARSAKRPARRCSPSRRLGQVRYRVDGVDKSVRFWAMRHVGGEFAPSDEVDKLEWLAPSDARRRLSYPGERTMVDDCYGAAPLPTSVVVVIRHAKAGKRSDWSGPDELRPLERTGRAQAKALADVRSACSRPSASSRPIRCAACRPCSRSRPRLGLPIEIDAAFSDRVSARRLRSARGTRWPRSSATVDDVAVCSQGDTIDGAGRPSRRRRARPGCSAAGPARSSVADYYGAAPTSQPIAAERKDPGVDQPGGRPAPGSRGVVLV